MHGLCADLNLTRLGRLGHFVHQIDVEHAVVEIGAGDLHVIGEAKPPLEGAPRDPAAQVAGAVLRSMYEA